jgi:two-component system response regulator
MLIEDNPDHVLLIRRAIRDLGDETSVDAINDGEQALTTLRSGQPHPDLILLDINMPGYSGFDVLTRLRDDDHLKRIPVVMLTSSDAQNDIARAYELGASGYIAKPTHYRELRAILGNTVLYWSAMQRAADANERLDDAP